MSGKYEEEFLNNKKKMDALLEITLEKLKNDHFHEISNIKSENERYKKILEEASIDISTNYVKKTEHFKTISDLEELLEELKKDLEEKEIKFHNDLLQKQRFYEEKFQRDVDILQNTTSRNFLFRLNIFFFNVKFNLNNFSW